MINIAVYKKALRDKGLTQIELSKLSGVSLDTVRSIFTGRVKNPRVDTIRALNKVLGIGDYKELAREYLTEQEEALLQRFRALSKKGRSAALKLVSVLDSYENN